MKPTKTLEHFSQWAKTNYSLLDDLNINQIFDLYRIFQFTNPDYSIQMCLEECEPNDGLVKNYNDFATKNYGFNRFIDGVWEERF